MLLGRCYRPKQPLLNVYGLYLLFFCPIDAEVHRHVDISVLVFLNSALQIIVF